MKILKYTIYAILGIAFILLVFNDSSNNSSSYKSSNRYTDSIEENSISKDEAIDSYWDDIKDYVNGTETIEACSDSSGNCYDLEADISDGNIETLHFDNGGYLSFYDEFSNDGTVYTTDDDGNGWELHLNMDSSIVDDAVSNWASDNDYTIE